MPHNVLYTSKFGALTGGGQRSILLLMTSLSVEFKPYLFLSEDGSFAQAARDKNIPVEIYLIPSLNPLNIFRIVKSVDQIREILKKYKINVIHTETSRMTLFFGYAAKRLNIPVIFHARVSTPEPIWYEKILYSLSRKVIAVSGQAASRFKAFKDADKKVDIIYNAVDLNVFHQDISGAAFRQEIKAGEKVVVGLIGELCTNKGQDIFLEAAADILKRREDVLFVVIGEDNAYKQKLLAKIQQLSIGDHIVFLDFRDDIVDVMAGLDVLVNASRMEGFCRVIIEAMALSKAVIATNVGGNPEAIEHDRNGLLIEPNNSLQLAEAILTLVVDENKRKTLGHKARETVEEKFSLQNQVNLIEAVYKDVLTK